MATAILTPTRSAPATSARPAIWRIPRAAREAIWNVCSYTPSAPQRQAHLDEHRSKCSAGGERGGKSFWTAMEILLWCLAVENGLVWIVGPDYEQARPEMRHLLPALERMGLLDGTCRTSLPTQGAWSVELVTGTRIETKTSVDVTKIAGMPPDGVAMVEAAQQPQEAYLRCRGRVGEKRGPLVMSGTFEGSLGWYADLWRRWQADNVEGGRSFSLPTWSNLAIYPGGRQDPEILALEAAYPADVFGERFGAVPCAPSTIVFREFDPTVHVSWDASYTEGTPVQLWVDPGYAHGYAVVPIQLWPKRSPGQVWQIDEVHEAGLTAPEIIERCKARPWWGDVRTLVMDVAGKAHPGAESQAEIWARLTGLQAIMKPVPVVDGILRHRTFLKDPETGRPRLLHNPKCTKTIAEYQHYRYAVDHERSPATELPIDRDNHALKALAYGLVANYGHVAGSQRRPKIAVEWGS